MRPYQPPAACDLHDEDLPWDFKVLSARTFTHDTALADSHNSKQADYIVPTYLDNVVSY